MSEPRVVIERDGFRLVHQPRESKSWDNISDLTLERSATDSMGEPCWFRVDSWCLSPQELHCGRNEWHIIMALKLLLDSGTVIKKD